MTLRLRNRKGICPNWTKESPENEKARPMKNRDSIRKMRQLIDEAAELFAEHATETGPRGGKRYRDKNGKWRWEKNTGGHQYYPGTNKQKPIESAPSKPMPKMEEFHAAAKLPLKEFLKWYRANVPKETRWNYSPIDQSGIEPKHFLNEKVRESRRTNVEGEIQKAKPVNYQKLTPQQKSVFDAIVDHLKGHAQESPSSDEQFGNAEYLYRDSDVDRFHQNTAHKLDSITDNQMVKNKHKKWKISDVSPDDAFRMYGHVLKLAREGKIHSIPEYANIRKV